MPQSCLSQRAAKQGCLSPVLVRERLREASKGVFSMALQPTCRISGRWHCRQVGIVGSPTKGTEKWSSIALEKLWEPVMGHTHQITPLQGQGTLTPTSVG